MTENKVEGCVSQVVLIGGEGEAGMPGNKVDGCVSQVVWGEGRGRRGCQVTRSKAAYRRL